MLQHLIFYDYTASDKIMVKDHLISNRENPLPSLSGFLIYMHHPTANILHVMDFGTPFLEHWMEREIGQ